MSCFVFVVLAEGLGFLSFLGVVLACPSCFLGLLGFSVFLVRSAPACWGGWRVAGGSGVRGRRARVSCFLLVGGRVWGASARARFLSCPVLAVVGVGGRVRGCARRPVPAVWWGSGCARFPVRVRGVVVVFAGGFRVLFFSVRCFSCSPGFRCWSSWSCRGLGVVGGVGLGSGLFFLRLLLYWPGLVSGFLLWGAGLGLGWVLFGEFDPGSGRTLAACLTHASRTGPPLWGWVEWRTGEYHVSNLPPAPG